MTFSHIRKPVPQDGGMIRWASVGRRICAVDGLNPMGVKLTGEVPALGEALVEIHVVMGGLHFVLWRMSQVDGVGWCPFVHSHAAEADMLVALTVAAPGRVPAPLCPDNRQALAFLTATGQCECAAGNWAAWQP